MFRELFDVILPRECIVCGDRLDADEEQLCARCREDLPLTYTWTATRNPMADKFNALLQKDIEEYEPYVFASSLFFYGVEADYRKIPQAIKYHGNLRAGAAFGRMLGERLGGAGHFSDVDMVIPVPLHWMRKWRRGYNQAEIIAAPVARALGAEIRTDLLRRRRMTGTQTRLDPAHREGNVRGAFATTGKCPATLHGVRHILLVDDVFTTGSTLKACHGALRACVPKSVRISVATLCLVE